MDEYGFISLVDFGLSKLLGEDKVTESFCGTPDYMSPEVIKGSGHNHSTDWWGLGILM